jgi:peptidyl-prolyl cis-trans isomerase D
MLGFGVLDFVRYTGDYVIKVEDKKVTLDRFSRYLDAQKRQYIYRFGSGIIESLLNKKEFSAIIVKQMADQLLIAKMLEDNGVVINKDTVNEYILNHPQFQGMDGTFDEKFYKNYIAQLGFSEEAYIADQISAIQTKFLTHFLSLNEVTFLDNIAKKKIMEERQKRKIEVRKLKFEELKNTDVSEQEILSYYNKNREKYTTKEEKKILIAKIDAGSLNQDFIKNEDIIKEYNKQYLYKNQKVSFYKLSFPSLDEAKRVEDLVKQEGLAFTDVARENLGLKSSEIYFANLYYKDLDRDFADAISSLSKSDISPTFYASGQYHIIKLDAVSTSNVPSLESVKPKIIQGLKSANSCSNVEKIAQKISDEVDSGETLQNALQGISSTTLIIKEGEKSPLPENISNLILSDTDTYYAKIVKSKPCEFYAYKVEEVKPQSYKDIESVKGLILAEINSAKMRNEALIKANNLREKLVNANSFDGEALTITQNADLNFASKEQLGVIFNAKVGDVMPPFLSKNGDEFVIVKLVEVIDFDESKISTKDLKEKIEALRNEERDAILTAYLEELRKKYRVSINPAYL